MYHYYINLHAFGPLAIDLVVITGGGLPVAQRANPDRNVTYDRKVLTNSLSVATHPFNGFFSFFHPPNRKPFARLAASGRDVKARVYAFNAHEFVDLRLHIHYIVYTIHDDNTQYTIHIHRYMHYYTHIRSDEIIMSRAQWRSGRPWTGP